MTIRIVLADDHEIVRDGVRLLIERETDMKLVGEANDGWEAIRLAAELQPDVLIMDITMNGLNGIEATCELHRSHPKIRVLALSMHSDKRFVKKMLEAGACGFMLKNSAGKELISAIRTIHNRSTFLSQPIIDLMVADYGGNGAPVETPSGPQLTVRERETLQLLAEGNNTKEIAARLKVSVKTIETYRAQIMEKLGIHSLAGLVKHAIREGLTTIDR